jgi:hypothetical protein
MLIAEVHSSNGTLWIDANTGVVLRCEEYEGCDGELVDIYAVDLDEYFSYWKDQQRGEVLHFDILDLGLWYVNERGVPSYTVPEQEWRDECSIISGYHKEEKINDEHEEQQA